MLNLDAVMDAIRRLADNTLGGMGWRQITVSTVGIIPGMDRLADSGLGVHLAVSLHAPDDVTRARILPTGRRYLLADILAAADGYQEKTGRPVSLQYCLLRDVNDTSSTRANWCRSGNAANARQFNHYNPTGVSLQGLSN
jgi:23S rRNA (adenine2503-C2)-methyltransferase